MRNIPYTAHKKGFIVFETHLMAHERVRIDFFDAKTTSRILHVSLRAAEKLAVANDYVNRRWGKELRGVLEVDPNAGSHRVALAIGEKSARLCVDGRTVLRLPHSRFRISLIDNLTFGAEIDPDSVRIDGRLLLDHLVSAKLEFAEDFLVTGRCVRPRGLSGEVRLGVSGLDQPLDCVFDPEPEPEEGVPPQEVALGLRAVLPGRVWLGRGEGEPLELQLVRDGGAPLGEPLALTREDVVRRIEKLAQEKKPETAVFETLCAIEHVKFGGLSPLLSPAARSFVAAGTRLFNLAEFLPEAEEGLSAPPEPTPAPSAEKTVLAALRLEFAQAVGADRPGDPLEILNRICAPLQDDQIPLRQSFLTPLGEYFCQIDRFEDFFALWSRNGAVASEFKPLNNGERSQALPYLFLRGEHARVGRLLEEMSQNLLAWLHSASIRWTVEAALRPGVYKMKAQEQHAIVQGFMKLVEAHAAAYWARLPCRNLTDASLALLEKRRLFPEALQESVVAFALRCHGFSAYFWEEWARRSAGEAESAHPLLEAGREAFRVLRTAVEAASASPGRGEAVETALRFFAAAKAYEEPRVRLEVLGPAGQLDSSPSTLLRLAVPGEDPGEALLRHLAFPGAPELDTSLAPLSRRAIRKRLSLLTLTDSYEMRSEAARRCRALLVRLAAEGEGPEAEADLERLLALLHKLSGRPAQHADLGIGIALYCDLLRDGRAALAQKLEFFLLGRFSALSRDDVKALPENAMLRSLHRRFAVTAARCGSDFAKILLDQYLDKVRPPELPAPEPLAEFEELWFRSSALFDTLAIVYSCRAHLETRVAQARETWLRRLEALGIPYLVVVGEGRGEVHGDVLEVEAPDSYEALPQKTTAMLRWAERHTSFAHVLKIDDDCMLDPEAYFFSLNHRFADYYGRPLKREVGLKPRMWHMSRSASLRGRLELDKSPEPSFFVEGGTGYALSRRALSGLVEALRTPQGGILAQVSFSEDKLVGDLLSLCGILPQSEDYAVAVVRDTHPGGHPVMRWETTFFPGLMSGIKLAHLDAVESLARREAEFDKGALFPKKIWPTSRPVRLRSGCNSMTLVSPAARLEAAAQARAAVVSVVRNELFMLPHFLAHYRKLGVEGFFFVDNLSDDGTLEYLLEQPDAVVFSADGFFRSAAQGSDWKLAMMAQFRLGKWTLAADGDEFLVYPGYETRSLPDFLADPAHGEADAFLSVMLDMYPRGPLSEADFSSGDPFAEAGYAERKALLEHSLSLGSFSNRPTRTSSLRHRLIPGSRAELFVSEKIALVRYKPWMRFSVSLHHAAETRLAAQPLLLAHFKYNAEFRAKALREIARGQYFNDAEEYKKYVDILSEGRDVVFDPECSVPWRECVEAQEILGPVPVWDDRNEEEPKLWGSGAAT